MPDPIRSIRRSPDSNRVWIGAGSSVSGSEELRTADLVVDGHLTVTRIICVRLDIGPGGTVSCTQITVTHSAYIAGTLEASTLDTPRPVVAATGAILPPRGKESACAVSSMRAPRIEFGAQIHASFRPANPTASQPKGGTLVAFRPSQE